MQQKSKIDWWVCCFVILLTAITVCLVYYGTLSGSPFLRIMGSLLFFIVTLLVLPIIFHTKYTLGGSALLIRCGVFYKITVPYEHVTSVETCRSYVVSSALSADRIAIAYTQEGASPDTIYISPKDKETFIDALRKQVDRARTIAAGQ